MENADYNVASEKPIVDDEALNKADEELTPEQLRRIKSIEITLSVPIKFGSEIIKKLELKRPTAKDISGLSASPSVAELLRIAGKLARQPRPVMDALDGGDAMEVVEAVSDFLDSGQKTTRKHKF